MIGLFRAIGAITSAVVGSVAVIRLLQGAPVRSAADRGLTYASWSIVVALPLVFLRQLLAGVTVRDVLARWRPGFWATAALVVILGGGLGLVFRGLASDRVAAAYGLLFVGTFGGLELYALVKRLRGRPCPDCRERVKLEARVCRHCGYRFEPPLASDARAKRPE